ncbi:MAG: DUF4397 domain-containing protein [Actinomycetota bacterium]|nr:DUF4397 domain-containing protein [Actinomycetota bacterium]
MRRFSLVMVLVLAVLPGLPAAAQETGSTITVVHAVEGDEGFPVDLYVNGELVVSEISFGMITEALRLSAASYEVELYPAGANPAIEDARLSATVRLSGGAHATVVANVTETGQPTLTVFVDDTSQIPAGQARVTLRHGAVAPEVDVLAEDEVLIGGLANQEEGSAEVPEGSYTIEVVPTGEPGPALFEADLDLTEGTSYVIYGIGSVEGDSFDVAVQVITGLQTPPAFIPTGTGGLAADARPGNPLAAGSAVPSEPSRSSGTLLAYRPAGVESLSPNAGPPPVSLRIDALGVEAPVVVARVDAARMEVPQSVSQVAWYEYGPAPGESGSAVMAAHVDLAGRGPGVFFGLDRLRPGDVIVVGFEDGSERRFRVEALARYEKGTLPLDRIFARDGHPVLTLVTCGGTFDRSTRLYDSNVVVYARPVPAYTWEGALLPT